MNGAFHSKRDVDRLYVSREDGGRADSLWWYVKNSWNVLLQGLRGKVYWKWGNCQLSWLNTSWNNELKLDSWKEKKLHGQFYDEYPEQHM